MPICGFLIANLGWESAFYFTGKWLLFWIHKEQLKWKRLFSGGIGLLWSILWFVVIYDSPATHPRISPEEKYEIESAIGTSTSKKRPSRVPWREILTSAPVWAVSILVFWASSSCIKTFLSDTDHHHSRCFRLLLLYCSQPASNVYETYLALQYQRGEFFLFGVHFNMPNPLFSPAPERICLIIPLLWQIYHGCLCLRSRWSSHEERNIDKNPDTESLYGVW